MTSVVSTDDGYIYAIKNRTAARLGGRAFLCPPAGQNLPVRILTMANQLENLTRRNFLSGTAGAISGAVLLPGMPELEQMAQALHDAVGRYSDEGGHVQVCADGCSLNLDVDNLRSCSVDEIQQLLSPLYQGGAS